MLSGPARKQFLQHRSVPFILLFVGYQYSQLQPRFDAMRKAQLTFTDQLIRLVSPTLDAVCIHRT
jgi:hypothetical protein